MLRVISLICIVLLYCLLKFLKLPNKWLYDVVLKLMRLCKPIIIGKKDPTARVIVFNHPTHLEQFILIHTFGEIVALVRHMFEPLAAFFRYMDCVLVHKNGKQNTTIRIRENLQRHNKPIIISTSVLDTPSEVCNAGVIPGSALPERIPTIAYRIGERVQPVVIAYKGIDLIPNSSARFSKYLMCQRDPVQSYLFILPSIDPAEFSSAEDCSTHVRQSMMKVLKYFDTYQKESTQLM